jgi:hypothetical protein
MEDTGFQSESKQVNYSSLVQWSFSIITAVVIASVFMFNNFETKIDSKDKRDQIQRQLDQISSQQREILNILIQMRAGK